MVAPRMACVDVPALPLQLLLRARPQWRSRPVVVVKEDRPQGLVLCSNAHARRHRVVPGMTFAAAQSLVAGLHASEVPADHVDACIQELHHLLSQFSPRVESSRSEPGVFWLDPTGLALLYGSLEEWARMLHAALAARAFRASLVVGFHRYRCYALARSGLHPSAGRACGPWVLSDPHTENRWSARVPLIHLGIDPQLRDQLAVLGVHTLGQLLHLPAAELRLRFGEASAKLHHAASDEWAPLRPRVLENPVRGELQLEPPDSDHTRLLFGLRGLLHNLLQQLAHRSQALALLHIRFELDHASTHHEYIEPARPTLDLPLIIELVRLRLDALSLPAAVESIHLELEGILAESRQLALFQTHQKRDLEGAGRALARLRASLGAPAVTRARLRSAHLPEASFAWEPALEVRFPRPRLDSEPPLCRRVFPRPIPLPHLLREESRQLHGPYRISGGWWARTVERDYYFAETHDSRILWVYYDRFREKWLLHGIVD